jgi:hypothetical protein
MMECTGGETANYNHNAYYNPETNHRSSQGVKRPKILNKPYDKKVESSYNTQQED